MTDGELRRRKAEAGLESTRRAPSEPDAALTQRHSPRRTSTYEIGAFVDSIAQRLLRPTVTRIDVTVYGATAALMLGERLMETVTELSKRTSVSGPDIDREGNLCARVDHVELSWNGAPVAGAEWRDTGALLAVATVSESNNKPPSTFSWWSRTEQNHLRTRHYVADADDDASLRADDEMEYDEDDIDAARRRRAAQPRKETPPKPGCCGYVYLVLRGLVISVFALVFIVYLFVTYYLDSGYSYDEPR